MLRPHNQDLVTTSTHLSLLVYYVGFYSQSFFIIKTYLIKLADGGKIYLYISICFPVFEPLIHNMPHIFFLDLDF
jgi:hypothetical protein